MLLVLQGLPLLAAQIGSIRQLLALTPEAAVQGHPVTVEAVLLVDDRFRSTFFIHDGTASCYARIRKEMQTEDFQQGRRYLFTGTTQAGGYRPVIEVSSLKPTGPGKEPLPRLLSPDDLFKTEVDSQWVEMVGRVDGSVLKEGGPCLQLSVQGWVVDAFLPREESQEGEPPWHLIGQQVRVKGVAASVFNDERQMTRRFLYVPSLRQVAVVGAPVRVPAAPVKVTSLLRVGSELKQPVRLRGIVTHSIGGEVVYLKDSSGSLRIYSSQPTTFMPGDEIESEGFPALEPLRPALHATQLRKVSSGPPPQPTAIDPAGKLATQFHHELVSLEADLLALRERAEGLILQCQQGNELFEAVLEGRMSDTLHEQLQPGSRLRLTGMMELRPSKFFYSSDWIDGFRLHLRGGHDLEILAIPPWWNARRLSWLLVIAVLAGVGGLAWAATLRRVVRSQTVVIKEKVERTAILEERQRIAREMHDTFQQSLAGAGHLLDESLRRLQRPGQDVQEPLKLARHMLRHCRDESRAAITELRSITLQTRPLPDALAELLGPVVEGAGMEFQLHVAELPPDIEPRLAYTLLRISQEAVANAVTHGKARRVQVRLEAEDTTVVLMISDDGQGFDPARADSRQGHFGITGMKERAAKLGGQLEITSFETQGTRVTARLPILPPGLDEPLSLDPA